MIAGAWVLVGLPLLVAPLVYLVRRWAFPAAMLAGGAAAVLAWLCFTVQPAEPLSLLGWSLLLEQPVSLLGRQMALTLCGQMALGLLYGLAAVSFLLAWPVSPGRSFFPLGLALLSGWAAAVLMQHLAFAVILLWLISTLATMVIQGGRPTSTRGAGRQMVLLTLIAPLLLLVSTLIEARAANPDDFTLTQPTMLLTAIGLGGLLAAYPFEGWVSAMVTGAQPGVVALLISGYQVVILLLAVGLFHDQPWLLADGQVLSLLAWGGLLTVGIGGALAAVQRHFAPLLGYTVLNDLGMGLLALTAMDETGLTVAFLMVITRAIGLLLAGSGLAVIRQHFGRTSFAEVRGAGRCLPLAAGGLLLGGLSLGGLPFTAGFTGRWALLLQTSTAGGLWAWLPLLSTLGVTLGWLRSAVALWAAPQPHKDTALPTHNMAPVAGVVIAALMLACLWAGRHSDQLLLWLRPLVEAWTPLLGAVGP